MMRTSTHLLVALFFVGAVSLSAQTSIPGVTQLPGTSSTDATWGAPWPLAISGSMRIGNSLRLAPTLPCFTLGTIIGAARLDLELEPLFGGACTLVPVPTVFEIGGPGFALSLSIPNDPALVGLRFWAQPYYFDGLNYFSCIVPGVGSFALGEASELTILP